ncbi:MAG: MerR family transcriptional regulator [Rhodothermales bacterium]|nr:MerR family transcriptional regulator [Rhodothermales bacterium]
MSTNGIKKLYYSISEVAEMFEVEPHVLRYWESEFKQLAPKKNRAGRRTYRDSDIQMIKKIWHLLKVEKYTIEGARRALTNDDYDEEGFRSRQELLEIRRFLEQLLESI